MSKWWQRNQTIWNKKQKHVKVNTDGKKKAIFDRKRKNWTIKKEVKTSGKKIKQS